MLIVVTVPLTVKVPCNGKLLLSLSPVKVYCTCCCTTGFASVEGIAG
jgi:hypothetical protein